MKPSKHSAVDVESTFETLENFEMTIDPNAMAHLMHLLTNLYSDEELACIREYSTNAWDAHIEAGTTDTPIEVTTPTPLSPNLVIKDYGVGMDIEDIANVYSRYGATTKDLTNEQNGSMGIGGKAALAYTSQFTVIGTKNGYRTTVVVSRNVDGGGTMQIIGRVKTDEPNGVEVIIPAKPFSKFESKAQKLFRFWKKGTVLLNGVDPHAALRKISTHVYEFEDSDELDSDYVVMGNVAYPVDYNHSFSNNGGYVAFVSMDDSERVVFTPPREALIYNSQTNTVLEMLKNEYTEYITEHIQSLIDEKESHWEAYSTRNEAVKRYNVIHPFTYKGVEIPDGDQIAFEKGAVVKWNIGKHKYAVDTYGNTDLRIESLTTTKLIVLNYKYSGVSGAHKKRIKQYMREQMGVSYFGWEYTYLFRPDHKPDLTWIDPRKAVNWKTILEQTRDPREYSSGGGGNGIGEAYEYRCADGFKVEMPPEDSIVYYYSPAEHYYDQSYGDRIFKEEPKAVIISANKNRWGKLKRLFPEAKQYEPWDWRSKWAKEDFDAIPDEDLDSIRLYFASKRVLPWRVESHDSEIINREAEFLDRNVPDTLLKIKECEAIVNKYQRTFADVDRRWNELQRAEKPVVKTNWNAYPLADWSQMDETIEYINALYKCRNENKDET